VADVAVEQSLSYGGHYWGIPSVSADGRAVLYGVEDAHHPPDLRIAGVGFADRRRLTAINPELDKYELGSARLSTFAPMMTWRSGRCVAYWTPVLAFFDGPRRPFASAWQLPEGALGLGSSTGSERISTAAGPRGLAAPIIPVIIHA
jgi:hypothetical protein